MTSHFALDHLHLNIYFTLPSLSISAKTTFEPKNLAFYLKAAETK